MFQLWSIRNFCLRNIHKKVITSYALILSLCPTFRNLRYVYPFFVPSYTPLFMLFVHSNSFPKQYLKEIQCDCAIRHYIIHLMILAEIHTSCFHFGHQNRENSLSQYWENGLKFWNLSDTVFKIHEIPHTQPEKTLLSRLLGLPLTWSQLCCPWLSDYRYLNVLHLTTYIMFCCNVQNHSGYRCCEGFNFLFCSAYRWKVHTN